MSKELVVEEGYTIKVVSWENDGDHYSTKTYTVMTEDEAKAARDEADPPSEPRTADANADSHGCL